MQFNLKYPNSSVSFFFGTQFLIRVLSLNIILTKIGNVGINCDLHTIKEDIFISVNEVKYS